MKYSIFCEVGTSVLFCACYLRTCSPAVERTTDVNVEYFSSFFEDKTISVVRTRRIYSLDPWKWENPTECDEGVFEIDVWASMSNMYAIVVNDSGNDSFVFDTAGAELYHPLRSKVHTGDICVFSAKDNTLQFKGDGMQSVLARPRNDAVIVPEIVEIGKMFDRHKACPCLYFGNGKNGMIFFREGLDYRWCEQFLNLLRVGRPYDYYTARKFKTWDDFLLWGGVLDVEKRVENATKGDAGNEIAE